MKDTHPTVTPDHRLILESYLERITKTDIKVIAHSQPQYVRYFVRHAINNLSPEAIKELDDVIETEAYYIACEELI